MANIFSKLITLDNLKRYHQDLMTALGLTHPEGQYVYGGERTDYPFKSKTVSGALDFLYDLFFKKKLKDGTIEITDDETKANTLTAVNEEDGDSYDLKLLKATSDDISGLFIPCEPGPEPEPTEKLFDSTFDETFS